MLNGRLEITVRIVLIFVVWEWISKYIFLNMQLKTSVIVTTDSRQMYCNGLYLLCSAKSD